jgi:hypothetical protein
MTHDTWPHPHASSSKRPLPEVGEVLHVRGSSIAAAEALQGLFLEKHQEGSFGHLVYLLRQRVRLGTATHTHTLTLSHTHMSHFMIIILEYFEL